MKKNVEDREVAFIVRVFHVIRETFIRFVHDVTILTIACTKTKFKAQKKKEKKNRMKREKFENRKKERSDEERRKQEQSRRSRAPTTIEKKKKRSKIESYCFHTELYRTTCSFHLMLTVSSNCINVPSSPHQNTIPFNYSWWIKAKLFSFIRRSV